MDSIGSLEEHNQNLHKKFRDLVDTYIILYKRLYGPSEFLVFPPYQPLEITGGLNGSTISNKGFTMDEFKTPEPLYTA